MVKENEDKQPSSVLRDIRVNVRELVPGERVELIGGIVVEVIENPEDGMWIRAKYITVPSNPSAEGTEEQIFASDVVQRV